MCALVSTTAQLTLWHPLESGRNRQATVSAQFATHRLGLYLLRFLFLVVGVWQTCVLTHSSNTSPHQKLLARSFVAVARVRCIFINDVGFLCRVGCGSLDDISNGSFVGIRRITPEQFLCIDGCLFHLCRCWSLQHALFLFKRFNL